MKQKIVALSSGEAEYVAFSFFAKTLTRVQNFFSEITKLKALGGTTVVPTTVISFEDTAAILIAMNDQISSKNGHIRVKYHHVRYLVLRRVIKLKYIPTFLQAADNFSKPIDLRTMYFSNLTS